MANQETAAASIFGRECTLCGWRRGWGMKADAPGFRCGRTAFELRMLEIDTGAAGCLRARAPAASGEGAAN